MTEVQPRKAPKVEARDAAGGGKKADEDGGIEPRSEAERELLRALRDAG